MFSLKPEKEKAAKESDRKNEAHLIPLRKM